MHAKPDVSTLKKMTVTERKMEAMRQLKASFDRATREGTVNKRQAASIN